MLRERWLGLIFLPGCPLSFLATTQNKRNNIIIPHASYVSLCLPKLLGWVPSYNCLHTTNIYLSKYYHKFYSEVPAFTRHLFANREVKSSLVLLNQFPHTIVNSSRQIFDIRQHISLTFNFIRKKSITFQRIQGCKTFLPHCVSVSSIYWAM